MLRLCITDGLLNGEPSLNVSIYVYYVYYSFFLLGGMLMPLFAYPDLKKIDAVEDIYATESIWILPVRVAIKFIQYIKEYPAKSFAIYSVVAFVAMALKMLVLKIG